MDVTLDPLQSKKLISQSSIRDSKAAYFVRAEETKCSKTILDPHSNESIVVHGNNAAEVLVCISVAVPTSVNVNEDGEIGGICWCIDVKIQTILR